MGRRATLLAATVKAVNMADTVNGAPHLISVCENHLSAGAPTLWVWSTLLIPAIPGGTGYQRPTGRPPRSKASRNRCR